MKEPLVFSVCTIFVGSVVYAYAETVPGSMGSYMILISRSVIGLVAGIAFRAGVSTCGPWDGFGRPRP